MFDQEFHGKVAVLTGAASGIGLSVCNKLLSLGAKVTVIDKNRNGLDSLISRISKDDAKLDLECFDISSYPECKSSVDRIIKKHERIDILLNGAGIIRRKDVVQTDVEEWHSVINTNLSSVFYMCKTVIPHMKHQGGGKIVNIASGWGLVGGAKAASYCASKGGVVLLTKAMAVDHGPDGININCVCPGDTDTNMLIDEARQLGLADRALVEQAAERPLRRVGHPEDIANAIVFLCSSASSYMTGSSLVIDGGSSAGSV